ncbi:MAG: AAA family ATPase [Candidatus Saganbacteria bacterium]|nr:AAA family ATPase [Candidatus Saganbacteria bacterium]
MYSRLLRPPKDKSFFLFGPRGTGKTTWVKTVFPKALYLDLLESELFNDLLASPQRLESLIPLKFDDWIVLDEIQRVPELLNEVHRLIEKRRYRFVLTGSSARKIRRKGYNLLGGRALAYSMHQLTTIELGKDFDLKHSLRYGHLPAAYLESDPKAFLESYVGAYLREEIQQEGLTRNLSAFSRFLEAASFSQGSTLSLSSVARDCAVGRKVVEDYFAILEDLLIGYRLPVFAKKAKRRIVVHPKFYFFDVGLYRTLRPMGPLDVPEEAEGIAFESLLFQELKAINDCLGLGYQIYYWRTANNLEVDFVLYGAKGIFAFEVKRTGKVSGNVLSGLKAFLKDYPMAKAFFIYGGERRMREGQIDVVPLETALKELPALLGQSKPVL